MAPSNYPKNWLEAQNFINNINREFLKAEEISDLKYRARKLSQLANIVYTILSNLDVEIKASKENKKNLVVARAVILHWAKDKKIFERR